MSTQSRSVVRRDGVCIDQRRELTADIQSRRAIRVLHRRRRPALAIAGDIVDEQLPHQHGSPCVRHRPRASRCRAGPVRCRLRKAEPRSPPRDTRAAASDRVRRCSATPRLPAAAELLKVPICSTSSVRLNVVMSVRRSTYLEGDVLMRTMPSVATSRRFLTSSVRDNDVTAVETFDVGRRQLKGGHQKCPRRIERRSAWRNQQRERASASPTISSPIATAQETVTTGMRLPLTLGARPGSRSAGMRVRREEPTRKPSQPPRPQRRALDAGAVGGDARIGVHLAIQLGDEHERQPGAQALQETRALPDERSTRRSDPRRPACASAVRRPSSSGAASTREGDAPAESASSA